MVKREEIVKRGDGEMVGEEKGETKTKRMSPMEEKRGGKERRREGRVKE